MAFAEFDLPPHGGQRLITKSRLWKSWKKLRRRLRDCQIRDVVDYIDYDIDPDAWISRLIKQIEVGSYEPSSPERYSIGKSRGFSRWMTLPEIPDLVLFHAICALVVERAQRRRRKHRHVYFSGAQIDKARRDISQRPALMDYIETIEYGQDTFLSWMAFNQYRKQLIFSRAYKYIVTTDISNFFDSVVHAQLEAALSELGLQRSLLGLIQLMLERLMFRDPPSAHPRVGLPVDEFGCARCLAHLFLFGHDDRMVALVGEDGYTRYMDDQVFGVESEADAYRLLAAVNQSLRRIHLSPNASKSRIMKLIYTRSQFHFKANDDLDKMDVKWSKNMNPSRRELTHFRAGFRNAWKAATQHNGKGDWDKVLKRFYLAAGRLNLRMFVRRAHDDVLGDPSLGPRVAAYLRAVCDPHEFIDRSLDVIGDDRIVYPDVKRVFAEEFLKMDALAMKTQDRKRIRTFARRLIRQRNLRQMPSELGALLLLRFGDRRSARSLASALGAFPRGSDARGLSLVLAAFGTKYAEQVLGIGTDAMGTDMFSAVRLIQRVRSDTLPARVKARLVLRYDSVSGTWYLDTRTLVVALLYSMKPQSRQAIRQIIQGRFSKQLRSDDRAILMRYGLA